MLQMTGAFAEFERAMIQARIHAGAPLNDPDAVDKARLALGKGLGHQPCGEAGWPQQWHCAEDQRGK